MTSTFFSPSTQLSGDLSTAGHCIEELERQYLTSVASVVNGLVTFFMHIVCPCFHPKGLVRVMANLTEGAARSLL
jgi:hypothetical protein